MSRSRAGPVEFREGVNACASPGALAPIAAVCPGICRSEDYLSQAQAPLLKLAPRIKYPRAFFCCDCYSELIAGALFFISDFLYKSFQMRIGFAHIFQIVDLRFCHDGPMIIDAFKAIKRRRLLFALPHSTPLSVCWWLSRCWRAPHNFGQNCRRRSEVLGFTLRNFLAPFQRLP